MSGGAHAPAARIGGRKNAARRRGGAAGHAAGAGGGGTIRRGRIGGSSRPSGASTAAAAAAAAAAGGATGDRLCPVIYRQCQGLAWVDGLVSSGALFHDSLRNQGGTEGGGWHGNRSETHSCTGWRPLPCHHKRTSTCVEATDQVFAGLARVQQHLKTSSRRGALIGWCVPPLPSKQARASELLPAKSAARSDNGGRCPYCCSPAVCLLRQASATRSLSCDCVPTPAAAPSRPRRRSSAARLKPCVTGHSHPGERGARESLRGAATHGWQPAAPRPGRR